MTGSVALDVVIRLVFIYPLDSCWLPLFKKFGFKYFKTSCTNFGGSNRRCHFHSLIAIDLPYRKIRIAISNGQNCVISYFLGYWHELRDYLGSAMIRVLL
jgi:hypothetical protein